MTALAVTWSGIAAADPASIWTIPAEPGPVQTVHGDAATYENHHFDAAPPGANDFACQPSAAHPRPVILLHGTDSSAYNDYAALSPRLVDAGYCVFAVNYGRNPEKDTYGTEDMVVSGYQVKEFVGLVLSRTGAQAVDMIGYSQGATIARYYINRLGGAAHVGQWIGIASPSYGGVMYGAGPVAQTMPGLVDALTPVITKAVVQQMQGSDFLVALNAGGDTAPGVRYTTIGSRVDEVIQPFENIALHGPGATNLVVQDLCPPNMTGHFQLVYDPFTLQLIMNAMDPDRVVEPVCVPVALGTGIPEVIASAHS
nr:alpha/beta fold hydrolase [Antrihabitans sp. YC2-6]